ncbi:MAG: tyrosine-type recombinase/integrase [Verrucomicrobiae bacterium]|nr:tyrosine-type recombinase/integrase [Verrucomicrobiae bacterium]
MAWLYKRGDKWWMGWRIGDTQFLKSTGETEHSEAKKQLESVQRLEVAQKASALTEDYYRAATGKSVARVAVTEFFKAWLADSQSVTTNSTMNKYRQVVREFCAHIEAEATGLLMENVTVEQLNSFFNAKRKQLAPGTVKGYRRILSSVFISAQNQGKIKGNPVALSKGRTGAGDESATKKRPFTLIELGSLHVKANDFWRFMLKAGYYTGQSLGDLITLRAEAVDLQAGLITMNRRKTGRQVIIPISKELRQSFVSLWPADGRSEFWPQQAQRYLKTGASSFSQEFYDLLAGAGLVRAREDKQKVSGLGRSAKRAPQKLGFHNLRHTFVTHLKIGGAMDSVAKELAGHGSNAVSAVYTHLPPETLSKAIAQLPDFVK